MQMTPTLFAESEEELKNLLMKVKEESEKVGVKLNIQKTNGTVQKHQLFGASAFFTVQLSHPYMITGRTIALTRWTFVGKVMVLLFNMLSRLVINFSSKEQLSFNFMAVVTICSDFGAPKNKVCHCFHCFPIYFP